MRLVVRRRDAVRHLAEACRLLATARERTAEGSSAWRIDALIEAAEGVCADLSRFLEEPCPPAKELDEWVARLAEQFRTPEHFVSLAFSQVGGLRDAVTDGFTLPDDLRTRIDDIAREILDFIHESRERPGAA
jgi:hypothetical protein